jgi:outer membrane lipoprotein SlyB
VFECAVAGALAGSKISKDKTNRAIGAIGGAILGGLLGSEIEESLAGGKAVQFIVKPDNGEPFSLIQNNSEKLKIKVKNKSFLCVKRITVDFV